MSAPEHPSKTQAASDRPLALGEALAALFLANADRGANAANDEFVEALRQRAREIQALADRRPCLGRGRHRHSKSKHRLESRQEARQQRTVDIVDLRTGLTHRLTPENADAGLVALCGRPVLPAALVDPGVGYCWDWRSTIPSQRSG